MELLLLALLVAMLTRSLHLQAELKYFKNLLERRIK
jgi:hypothetical protein